MTATETLAEAHRPVTRRGVEQAKLERDLATWLQNAVRDRIMLGQGPPIDIPEWFREDIARGVHLRVSVEAL